MTEEQLQKQVDELMNGRKGHQDVTSNGVTKDPDYFIHKINI